LPIRRGARHSCGTWRTVRGGIMMPPTGKIVPLLALLTQRGERARTLM
jgi:hypothetical protein